MHRYKLTISYDGSNYNGWQIQPNGITIQQILQEALAKLYKRDVQTTGSGRTDSGVHAINQVVHFDAEHPIVLRHLNGILPPDIRANQLELVDSTFHARKSALQKTYTYYIALKQNAFLYPYTVYEPNFQFELVKQAAQKFVGTMDFTSFANSSKDSRPNKVRSIYNINLKQMDQIVEIRFVGNGFLYKQVRNMVGCLQHVSKQKLSIDQIEPLIQAKDRRLAPPAAKARGLFLLDVAYDTASCSMLEKEEKCQAPFFFTSLAAK